MKEGNAVSNQPLLSLCIPTNGVLEWVKPVLESIYCQNVDKALFEVIVTDNGESKTFQQFMESQQRIYDNLHYRKTNAEGFLNQIESFRDSNGVFIKFVNHRMLLKQGVIERLVNFVRENMQTKPITYFLNGSLPLPEKNNYETFDDFVRALSYYSSWFAGVSLWKEDFDRISKNISYNKLFPHTTILFFPHEHRRYYIDNRIIMESLPEDHPKGNYNLFYAFAVEYPSILCDLYRNEYITMDTFFKIRDELLSFLASLYIDYFIFKRKCSYDLSGMSQSITFYYSLFSFYCRVGKVFLYRAKGKLLGKKI